jgi:hypothetical protein
MALPLFSDWMDDMSLPVRESRQNELRTFDTALELVVLYTSPDLAREALKKAEDMAGGLDVHLRLIRAEIVPYQLPVDSPAINLKHLQNEMQTVVESSRLDVDGEIVLARDLEAAIRTVPRSGSIVILASHHRLWRTKEESLQHLCARMGYEVLMHYVS